MNLQIFWKILIFFSSHLGGLQRPPKTLKNTKIWNFRFFGGGPENPPYRYLYMTVFALIYSCKTPIFNEKKPKFCKLSYNLLK